MEIEDDIQTATASPKRALERSEEAKNQSPSCGYTEINLETALQIDRKFSMPDTMAPVSMRTCILFGVIPLQGGSASPSTCQLLWLASILDVFRADKVYCRVLQALTVTDLACA